MPNSEPARVSQADREAAADAYFTCFDDPPNDAWLAAMLAGKHDDDPLVQAFARHRLASTPPTSPGWQDYERGLEDAAKVAEAHSGMQCGPYTREVTTAIATAIRALKSPAAPEQQP